MALLPGAEELSVEPPQGSAAEVTFAESGAGGDCFPQGSVDETPEGNDFIPHGSEAEETGGRFQGLEEA